MAGPVRIAILANGAQASSTFRKTAGDASTMGQKFVSAGKLAAKTFAGVAVAGAVAGAKFTADAAKLNTKIREVVTLFGETGKAADRSIGRIQTQVRGLSNQFGLAQEELTGGLYSAISAGVPKSNALEFMRVASKAAIGGVTDVATTVDGLSSTINAFELDASDAKAVADSMFTAVKGGKTTFEELSNSLFNVAPAAAAAGVSFQEINAGIAALTAGGTPTKVASTQIRAALTGLQKPSADLDKIFQSLGYENAQLAVESKGLGFALRAVKDASKGNNGELQKLLGSTEAVSAANVIAGTGAKKFNDELRAQKDAAGAAGKAFKTVNAGAERSYDRLKTKLRNVGLQIGQTILPFALDGATALEKKLSPAIDGVGDKLSSLSDSFRADGLDGLIVQIEDMTGTSGKLSPILDELEQAADGVWRVVKVLGPAFLDAANGATPLLSPLKLVGDIAEVAADVLEALPDGLLSLGIQAGAAALILPRLTSAATSVGTQFTVATAKARQFRAELTYAETRSGALAGGLSRLGGAARVAGGIGGMLALSKGAEQADTKTGFLLSTIGGAALGSAGGPIGALIGGALGAGSALLGMSRKTDAAAEAAKNAVPDVQELANSFNELTGNVTGATRAVILDRLEKEGLVAAFVAEGVSRRTLIDAVAGEKKAREEVLGVYAREQESIKSLQARRESAAESLAAQKSEGLKADRLLTDAEVASLRAQEDSIAAMDEQIASRKKNNTALLDQIGRLDAARASQQAYNQDVTDFKKLVIDNKLPRRIITQFEENGFPETARKLAELGKKQRLTRAEVKTLFTLGDYDFAFSRVKKFGEFVKESDGKKAKATVVVDGADKAVAEIGKVPKAIKDADIGRKLSDSTKDAKPNTAAYKVGLQTALTQAKADALAGGRGVGANLATGAASGIAANAGSVSVAARQAVTEAILAAKAAARIQSPSRRMHDEVGAMLGRGMADGVDSTRDRQKRAGRDLVASLLTGVSAGSSGVGKAIDKITRLVEKQINLKDSKKESAREREVLRSLKDQFAALEKNGRQQDQINRQLDAARDKYRRLVSESKAYARSVRDGFIAFGSVVGLGQNEDGSVSTSSLLDQLRDRAVAAQRYAELIRKLTRAGLNDTTLQQIIDAGVDGGLATAEALTAGGASAISEVNALTQQIARSGSGLGAAMAKEFKQAGIDAAAGLVEGLKKREKQLDRIADRLGQRLAQAVKKALGINSPSRVFRDIGANTMRGLALGLDETYASSLGTRTAKALVSGYARERPTFTAAALSASAAPDGRVIHLRLTAEQVSQLQRGRQIAADLDVFTAAGGRRSA